MNTEMHLKKTPAFLVIAGREIGSFFLSPIAYFVIALFLGITGTLFFSTFFISNRASLRPFFGMLPILFAFFIPAMTMRLFSEEKRSGTIEMLQTLPVNGRDVVLGKFLGCMTAVVILLLPTLFYPLTISLVGDLDPGVIAGGYLGSLFLAAAFISIGIFTSVQTSNQIVAFITGFVICIFFALLDSFLVFLPRGLVRFFHYLSAGDHFANFARGVLDSRNFIYFISLSALFLSRAVMIVDDRRNI